MMEPTKPTTKRRYERVLTLDCPAEVYKLGLLSIFSKANIGKKLINVSEVGLQVSLTQVVSVGSKIRVIAQIPAFKDTIEGELAIRWCAPNLHNTDEFFAGAEFISMPAGQFNKIQQLRKASRSETYKQKVDTMLRKKSQESGNLSAFMSDPNKKKDPDASWAE
jgi:hypothetical protein